MDDERQPGGLGFALRDPYPWEELASLARAGESLGYRALFLPEIGARDALAAVTGLAGEATRLLLGPGVVPIASRTTRLLAMAAATAHERSGGRLLLGMGTGASGPGALDRLRDVVRELRTIFAGRGDGAATLALPSPPPIWIAALGPKAVRLGGEVADGVLLNWCTPERVALARGELAEAARSVGRDPRAVAVGVYVRAAVAPGTRAALRAAAAEYAGYPAYRRQFSAMGLEPSDPEALIDSVCLTEIAAGRDRLAHYRDAGADLPIVYPVVAAGPQAAAQARATLEAFAP